MGPRAYLEGCGKSRPHRDSIPGPPNPCIKIIIVLFLVIVQILCSLFISYSAGAVSLNSIRINHKCYSGFPSVNLGNPAVISSSAKVKYFVFLTHPDSGAFSTSTITTSVTVLSFWEELRLGSIKRRRNHALLSVEKCLPLWLPVSVFVFREVLKFLIKKCPPCQIAASKIRVI